MPFNFLVAFADSETGLITTTKPLDRESKSSYKIIIEVADNGQPPQSATRVLAIHVLDIDDHKPRFNRETVNSHRKSVRESVLVQRFFP